MLETQLATWFDSGLESFAKALASVVGGDEVRFRQALQRNLERSARAIVAGPIDHEGRLFTAICASLGAACHLLRVQPSADDWRRAYLDANATGGEWIYGAGGAQAHEDRAESLRAELAQALRNAGYLGTPSSLDERRRDVALRLAVHLLMRFLIVYAARCDLGTEPAVRRFRAMIHAA